MSEDRERRRRREKYLEVVSSNDLRFDSRDDDFDCDGFSTALDLSGLIDHLFAGGAEPCDPCEDVSM